MMKTFSKLHEQIRVICQPNPQVHQDPFILPAIWSRNVVNLYICLIFLLLSIVNGVLTNFSSPAGRVTLCSNILIFLMFLLLCRSYLWIFNLLYTGLVAFAGLEILKNTLDGVYSYLGYSFILLPFTMMRTGDIKMSSFVAGVQIFIYLTKFREMLINRIRDEDPVVFVDKFLKVNLFWFVTMIVVNFSVLRTLDKRTLELSRAKSAVEASLDNQKTFIFSFSHELRNPINSLLGNLQLVLQGEALSPKATQMIKVAKVCGQILLHGINNVLETGKREMGKLEVNPVPTQIHELFQRTWGIYGELLRQKKLESKLKIDEAIPPLLKIDAHKVNQVLLNLIGNSIKFTEQGSITVSCKWLKCIEVNDECFEPIPYNEEEEGVFEKDENLSRIGGFKLSSMKSNYHVLNNKVKPRSDDRPHTLSPKEELTGVLKIIVKDTGCGMKKEAMEKLFKKFSQVSENISQRQIGTGLGLFITKEICETMAGEIRVYSKPGVGTSFVVCIPTIALPSDPIQRVDTQAIISSLSKRYLKALVADDSPFNVNLISEYFSKFGGSAVSIAYNGHDAYMKYIECRKDKQELDVVVLDIDMPVMNGFVTCEKIRKYEKENQLKLTIIILISGNCCKEQIGEYIGGENGRLADCFLKKPVSFQEFAQSLYSFLSSKSLE